MADSEPRVVDAEKAVRELLSEADLHRASTTAQREQIFDAGLARVEFPHGLGGRGWPRALQQPVDRILRDAIGYEPFTMADNPIGIGMAAPTLVAHARGDDSAALVRSIFTEGTIWCQLFSEPSAGSDVAGISTAARRDGDTWVVTGEKVWTSVAHRASYGLLLARTDPTVPKHRGLSYFFVDMRDPQIEVRPLYQLTGEAEFNEVFLNAVRVPHANMLGDEGDGWKVATTTLMNEREAIGGYASFSDLSLAHWRSRREELGDSLGPLRDRLVQLWVESVGVAHTLATARERAAAGRAGPEGSVAKQAAAELQQRLSAFELEIAGARGLEVPEGYALRRSAGRSEASPAKSYLAARAITIAGGTSEVMRNILAERILGMPPDLRIDKDVPWNQIPRG